MPVNHISNGTHLGVTQLPKDSNQGSSFSGLLESEQNSLKNLKNGSLPFKKHTIIDIGTINEKTPTVSHILKNNLDFQDRCWNIIFSDINKNKEYTQLPPGTKVSINTKTNEILWFQNQGAKQNTTNTKTATIPVENDTKIPSPIRLREHIPVGVISETNPTVSHLLKNSDKVKGNIWNIIYNPINKNKPFNALISGTKVGLNTATRELTLNQASVKAYAKVESFQQNKFTISENNNSQNPKNASFSARFADSIKPYIGRPYKEIDCYGLVVRGLIKQGVNYQGSGGLRQSLEGAAKVEGLPENAFLNGEGLVEKAGTTLYTKSYNSIYNPLKQSSEIFSGMKKSLEAGHILSFSTESRGHTGVIAKRDNLWTYINSGLMDNTLPGSGQVSKKVGEEILEEEIKNWCKLAQKSGESLSVTVGRLDEEKLMKFSKKNGTINLSKI